jgi:hypothetical protein
MEADRHIPVPYSHSENRPAASHRSETCACDRYRMLALSYCVSACCSGHLLGLETWSGSLAHARPFHAREGEGWHHHAPASWSTNTNHAAAHHMS